MNYREAVEKEIAGEENDVGRHKELWGRISGAYEGGGVNLIASVLNQCGDKIASEFDALLTELRKKL